MRSSDKHYNDLAGIDSRTNPLTQNPKYARGGTNFAYSYRDELMKRHGFQKKIPGNGCEAGLMEYKFRDINTGESLTEILGIDASGNLNRLKTHRLELTKSGGTVDNYSLFYDETGTPTWKIVFYDSSGTSLGSVSFPETDTLLDLKTDINALALTGLTADVVDEDGVTVVSTTCLAYTLDTVIASEVSGSVYNPAWFWEQVPTPSATQVPFPNVVSESANENYEGPTWVNLNNAIYITDGGFPMKYDGYAVYRAGMPKITKTNGFAATNNLPADSSGDLTQLATYKYAKQLCFVDPNGVEIAGDFEPLGYYSQTLGATDDAIWLPMFPVGNSDVTNNLFPIFSCEVNNDQTLSGSGTKTLNVTSGHNIKVGMALRLPVMNAPNGTTVEGGFSWAYYEVTAVTGTTVEFNKTLAAHYMPINVAAGVDPAALIVLDNTDTGPSFGNLFKGGLIINACYVPDEWLGQVTDPYNGDASAEISTTVSNMAWAPAPTYGAFCRIYRTEANGSTLYRLFDAPVQHRETSGTNGYYILDRLPDSDTSFSFEYGLTNIAADEDAAAPLPRACSYLSDWQETLIQAGRPISPPSILGELYPMYDWSSTPAYSSFWATGLVANPWEYSEADLCDFQSIFWASQDAPEGFPQDGLHEFLVSTKFNDEIRGMIGNKDSFFVFKERSTGYLTGTLADNDLALEILEADVGTACHKVLQEVQGAIFFMDQIGGFWSVVAGRLPVFIGYGIEDEFRENARGLNFRKAVATNFRYDDKYICHVPGDSPCFFAFDYASKPAGGSRSAWLVWSGVNGNGGVLATANDELLVSSGNDDILWKQKFTNTKYDFSDHTSAIAFLHLSAWVNFGVPVIDKAFLKVWLNSIQGGFSIAVNQYMNYLQNLVASKTVSFPAEGSNKLAVKEYVNLKADKVSAMSVGFENNDIYADVRIQGWELEYSGAFDVNEARQ
jgi:hypothetical protein